MLAVSHSPTPSSVRIAASSNGDGKNADAAWLSWCEGKTMRFVYAPPSARVISRGRWSFCLIQSGTAIMNARSPAGALATNVSSRRSNFSSGFS